MRVLILLLVASACIVQTLATFDTVKDKITGGTNGNAAKAQANGEVSKGNAVTGFVADQAKKAFSLAQEKISGLTGKNEAKQSGEQEEQQPSEAQPKEKTNLLTGLVDKIQKNKGSRTKRSVPEEPKKKSPSGILSKLKSFVHREDSKSDATKTEDKIKPKVEATETKPEVKEANVEKSDEANDEENVKSKSVTEADESEGKEVKGDQSESDDKAEHVRSKRSSGEGSEPEKDKNPLKRLAGKLRNLGSSSKPKQDSKADQKPKKKEDFLKTVFGDLDGDSDKSDNLHDEIVLT